MEKGLIENTNTFVEVYIPFDSDFSTINNDSILYEQTELKLRHRKLLNVFSPINYYYFSINKLYFVVKSRNNNF